MSSLPSSPSSTSSAPVTASAALSAPDPAGYGHTDPRLRRSNTGSRSDQPGRTSFTAPDRKRRLAHPENDSSWRHSSGTVESRGQVQRSSSGPSSFPPAVLGDPAIGSSYDTPIDLSSSPHPSRRTSSHGQAQQGDGADYVEYFLPRWQPDSEVTHCPVCNTPFSFWYRRHHCRKCGRVVCSSCSPHRITIPRQFIVRPSDFGGSPAQIVPAHAAQAAQHGNLSIPSSAAFNPALGGGEEVRLCNPCVPDPNPEPPRGYVVPTRHRQHHSMSSASRQAPHGPLLPERPVRSTVGSQSYRDFCAALAGQGAHQGGSLGHRPVQTLHRLPSREESGPSEWRSRFGHVTEAARRPHRPPRQVDERDICPVCNQRFPPLGNAGDEEAREAHIRECIEGHGPQARASSPKSPSHPSPVRMIGYPATEKDCLGQDGALEECTICMEEYEVGQSLVRLECLCRFHKRCIMEWFQRKKECPVHKVS